MKKNQFLQKLSPAYFAKILRGTFIFAPLCSSLSIIITILLLILAEVSLPGKTEHILGNVVFTLSLGFLYFLDLRLFCFVKQLTRKMEFLLSALLTIFLVIFYFTLPVKFNDLEMTRFFVLMTAGLVFLLLAGVSRKKDNISYAITIISVQRRLAESLLQLIIIYGGIASILGTLHALFDFDFREWIFIDIWIILSCAYFPFFFLHGLKLFYETETVLDEDVYIAVGKPVNVLFRYIIIPLLLVYLLILYAYFIKVIFLWDWPRGIASYLVITYSFIGLFTVIFAALRKKIYQKSALDEFFSKYFFWLIIPLLVVFYLAIFKRVSDYGFTEKRYLLLVLAIWLSFLTLFNLLKKEKRYFIIPVSFTIFSFLTIIGPWNMFTVSKTSQLSRFVKLCHKYEMISENSKKLIPAKQEVDFDDRKSLSSILRYFNSNYSLVPLKEYIPDSLYKEDKSYQNISKITKYLGFGFVSKYQRKEYENNYLHLNAEINFSYNLEGAKSLYKFNLTKYNYQKAKHKGTTINNQTLSFNEQGNSLVLKDSLENTIFSHPLDNLIKKCKLYGQNNYNIPQYELCDTISTDHQKYVLLISNLNSQGTKENGKNTFKISNISGYLITFK